MTYAGALDMGGASTQITYVPSVDILSDYFNLRLPNHVVNLYTHSYLHFGLNEATARINELVVNTSVPLPNGAYGHPCLNTGYTMVRAVCADTFRVS